MQPVLVSGDLTYSYLVNGINSDTEMATQTPSINLRLSTYFWQPWVAVLDSHLMLTESETETKYRGSEGQASTNNVENLGITGGFNLTLLPSSWFPLNVFYTLSDAHSDSSFDSGPNFSTNTSTTGYGLRQEYRPESGATYGFSYLRNLVDTESHPQTQPDDQQTQDIFTFNFAKGFDKHRVNYDASWQNQSSDTVDNQYTLSSLAHSYGREGFSIDTTQFFTQREDQFDGNSAINRDFQIFSSLGWNVPASRPLTLRGFSRFRMDSNTDAVFLENPNWANNLSGTYRWTDNTSSYASLASTVSDNRLSGMQNSESVTLGSAFDSDQINLRGFNYGWSTDGQVFSSSSSDGSDQQGYSVSAGQGVSRGSDLWGGMVSTSLGENFSYNDNSQRASAVINMNHNLSVNWSRQASEGRYSSMSFTLSDNRGLGEEDMVFQQASLQVTQQQDLSRVSTWGGDLSVQANRQEMGSSNNFDTTNPENDNPSFSADEDWDVSSSVNLYYRNRMFAGVQRLQFKSALRFTSTDLYGLYTTQQDNIANPEDQTRYSWRNELNYPIGRLILQLRVEVREQEGENVGLVLFRIRREFGGQYW